jgi:predicted amidohydrolase YtcJ
MFAAVGNSWVVGSKLIQGGMDVESSYATKVYQGGTVLTLDGNASVAEAVAVKGDKIIAVDTKEAVAKLIGDATTVIDLKGKTVIPGFYDAHSHSFMMGEADLYRANLNSPPIGRIEGIDDCINALKEKAKGLKPGQWVLGRGYDDSLLKENRHPTRYDLDRVSTELPVYAAHISEHFAAANSKALEIAGITKETIAPEGGVIRKDSQSGEPDGVFEETAMDLLKIHIPPIEGEQVLDAIVHAGKEYAKKGVTTANEGSCNKSAIVSDYQKAIASGRMPIRTVLWFDHSEVEAAHKVDNKTSMLSIGGVKVFQDGSIQGYTGYLTKPYHVLGSEGPDYLAYPTREREALIDIVKKAHNNGFQVMIHGNGDAAIDDILAAYGAAQQENPRQDSRHVVIHAQMAREDQLDKMKELGVIPSFFVLHTYYWGDRHRDIFLGPERAFRISPCKSALNRDLLFTLHCDTPVVPQDPLLLIWSAVNRLSTSGSIIGEEQRIAPIDALRAYTINAAYQNFEEDIKGSIEPGKLADMVILSDNPLTCDPLKIKDIEVLETIVGGNTVYKSR